MEPGAHSGGTGTGRADLFPPNRWRISAVSAAFSGMYHDLSASFGVAELEEGQERRPSLFLHAHVELPGESCVGAVPDAVRGGDNESNLGVPVPPKLVGRDGERLEDIAVLSKIRVP